MMDSDNGDDALVHARSALQAALRAHGERLGQAIDDWQRAAGATMPPEASAFMRNSMEQTRILLALAGHATATQPSHESDARASPAATPAELLWQAPLDIWSSAVTGVLGATRATPSQSGVTEVLDYEHALEDYRRILLRVGRETFARVAERWHERRGAEVATGGLRELLDLLVDEGEARYLEAVSREHFAEIGGRLLNALTALARVARADARWNGNTGNAPARATRTNGVAGGGGAVAGDVTSLLSHIGIDPASAVEELRAFGDKLQAALATLEDIGEVDVGTSTREVILREGKMTLFHYGPGDRAPLGPPLLIVYALANRPYMLDLEPRRSLIRALIGAGLDVYLIDWGYPDEADAELGLDHYINVLIDRCVDRVRADHGIDRLNVLGVCQGGTFALCYAALNPHKVGRLVLMVTPVDFHTQDNLLTLWLRHVDVDALVDTLGNIPGELLNWAFVSLKPLRLTGYKYLEMLDAFDDPDRAKTFLRMEKWIHDSPAQAGEAFRQFTKDLYQNNRLIKGDLHIGARRVDLANVTMPVLNIHASEDHIVPPSASRALEQHVPTSDYTSHAFKGGHIGIYVSERAQREIPATIAAWLLARSGDEP